MPSRTSSASARSVMLQGVISFHELAMPTCGLAQSSSVSPMARSIARAGAFCIPSVTSRERGLMSTGVGSRGSLRRRASEGSGPGGLRASTLVRAVPRSLSRPGALLPPGCGAHAHDRRVGARSEADGVVDELVGDDVLGGEAVGRRLAERGVDRDGLLDQAVDPVEVEVADRAVGAVAEQAVGAASSPPRSRRRPRLYTQPLSNSSTASRMSALVSAGSAR